MSFVVLLLVIAAITAFGMAGWPKQIPFPKYAKSKTPVIPPPGPIGGGTPTRDYPSTGIAVAAGDTVAMNAWSNTSFTIRCNLNFRAVGGSSPASFTLPDLVTGSTRAQISASAVVLEDGVVDALAVVLAAGTIAAQRGQTYVQVGINRGGAPTSYTLLAADYFFMGNPLTLGHIVPPGPAGGHGQQSNQATDNPAAGVQHGAVAVPTGAMWRVRSYRETVTAFTAAAKSITIRNTVSDELIGQSSNRTPAAAAGRIDAAVGAPDTIDTVTNGFVLPISPNNVIQPGGNVQVTVNGLAGADDLAAGDLVVEEWVMPN